MRTVIIDTDKIYVPVKMRKELNSTRVEELAEDILDNGQKTPIQVRMGQDRYVLIKGQHRLEAIKSLGEATIEAIIVQARRH
ncbi:MAG: chromosome partitioning protein ParB [Sneathiella sp.]|jgi:ParB/RepB/Spo0J family partition protein|uniref:ParB N-terminal domain-containing protein n=1 Tax=Sneathiella sp. TaxID=1964365 RepID=UPI000C60D900|nr:ParB N-terminal domain-containing protein [Sneathiella sp.]MAL78704.1 chromosome partitioning protein ParB [Sneathiella sp.]